MATKKSAGKKSSTKSSAKKPAAKKAATRRPAAGKSGSKKASSKKRAVRRGAASTTAAKAAAQQLATCTIKTRGDVSRLVLQFIRSLGFPSAVEASDFTSDIVVSPNARRGWATSLRNAVSAKGCSAGNFGPDDCANAGKVADIVDTLAGTISV